MKTQSKKIQAWFRVGLVVLIVVVLNIISIRIFGRLDVTRNNVFSLSDASKVLVRSLDDRVTIRAYFTDDLPAPYNANRRLLLDELNEYKAYARGNIQFEFIDPTSEKVEREAQQQGISPVQVQVMNQDKLEVKKAYMGLVFLYADKKETLPVVQNTSSLEYDISSTIKKLTSKGQKQVGFLTGHGEPPPNEFSHAQEFLRRQYMVKQVDVSKGKPVPPEVAVLMVIAPTSRIPESDKLQIDQFVMRGGRVAFLLNKVDASLQAQYGRPVETGLDDMLAAYGLRVNTDLVRDVQCANISIMQQQFGLQMQSQVPFPYLPLVSSFDRNNAIVKDLQGVLLVFPSSVDTLTPAANGLSGEILLRSSKESGRLTGMFTYDPLQHWTKDQFPEHGIPLAAITAGVFHSLYAGKPLPADTAAGSLPPPASPLTESKDTRVILVGDGDFVKDQTTSRDNITFFANMVDYLADDAGLITIRSKDISQPPLDPVSDGSKQAIKLANLVVPPLLVLAYGLFRWRIRRARKLAS